MQFYYHMLHLDIFGGSVCIGQTIRFTFKSIRNEYPNQWPIYKYNVLYDMILMYLFSSYSFLSYMCTSIVVEYIPYCRLRILYYERTIASWFSNFYLYIWCVKRLRSETLSAEWRDVNRGDVGKD